MGSGGNGPDCTHNIYLKLNYDFLNNFLYLYLYLANFNIWNSLYLAVQQFYYPELYVSGYQVNFTIRASLDKRKDT